MKNIIKKSETFIKYLFSSGICFITDLTLFTIFNTLLKNKLTSSIVISTILARIISSIINYTLNKEKVFKFNTNKPDISSFIKYYLLVVIQMFISSFAVLNIYKLTLINETIIKSIVDIIIFIANFFIQKIFIFNNKGGKKMPKKLFLILISFLSTISLLIYPIETSSLLKFNYDNILLTSSIVLIAFYFFYQKYYYQATSKKSITILSIIFSLLLVFGYSFHNIDSSYLVLGHYQYIILSILKFIGYYHILKISLNLLYKYLINLDLKKEFKNKWLLYFYNHPMKVSMIVLFISYLIYLIAYYPGVVGYDPSYQIKEMMGLPNFYADSVLITSTKTTLTAFNPIVHTLLIGGLFKLGLSLGSANLGIFFYTIIQFSIMITILSYSLKFLKEEKVPLQILLIILGIYAFIPVFPYYAICAFKDTYFALFFMLLIIELYKVIKYPMTTKRIIILILVSLGLCLFRKNGILTIILTLLSSLIFIKNNRKSLLIVLVSFLGLYFGYNKIVEFCEITPTSPREVLSIPIQQISALIVNKEEVILPEDRVIIGKIIDYNKVKELYNPELSDPVKNTYNKYATDEDLKNYFEVWFKYLLKEPQIYIEATINNIYGYFYPDDHIWYFYHKKYHTLNDVGFDYHYNSLSWLRNILYGYGEGFAYIPVIGLLVNIGATTWTYLYLGGLLLESNKKKYLLLLVPAFTIILSCVLGPVNTYYRYVLPYAITLPIILSLLYINKKELLSK